MKPQFRELMKRLVIKPFFLSSTTTIRLWIDWDGTLEANSKVTDWVAKLEKDLNDGEFVPGVKWYETQILQSAEENQIPLSALEILDRDGNGAVSYINW